LQLHWSSAAGVAIRVEFPYRDNAFSTRTAAVPRIRPFCGLGNVKSTAPQRRRRRTGETTKHPATRKRISTSSTTRLLQASRPLKQSHQRSLTCSTSFAPVCSIAYDRPPHVLAVSLGTIISLDFCVEFCPSSASATRGSPPRKPIPPPPLSRGFLKLVCCGKR